MDPQAYQLMGASVKTGENPIGFFGTGLKYAIAVFLRKGCQVTLWRGLERVDFTARESQFRSVTFPVIHANETALAFTTDYGKKWEPWQAMRELWCNALDEQGWVEPGQLAPQEGHTTIWVAGDVMDTAWEERHKVFLKPSHDWIESNGIRIDLRPANHLYLRGLRVYDFQNSALMTYDYHKPLELSEDRLAKYDFIWKNGIAKAIISCDSPSIINALFRAQRGTMEFELPIFEHEDSMSPTFAECLNSFRGSFIDANPGLIKLLVKKRGLSASLTPYECSAVEKGMIKRAIRFLKTNLKVDVEKYPIIVTESLEPGTLALADMTENQIFLSTALLLKGTKYVALGLYEEFCHLEYRFDDCTRPFQTFLLEKLMGMVEELQGEPL